MELNPNGLLAKLYKNSYKKPGRRYNYDKQVYETKPELPDNLCQFFWGLLWALMWLPFSWVGMLFTPQERLSTKVLIGFLAYLITAIAIAFVSAIYQQPKMFGMAFGVLAAFVIAGVSAYYIICLIIRVLFSWDIKKTEPYQVTKESIKAFKGKYCPRITWRKTA